MLSPSLFSFSAGAWLPVWTWAVAAWMCIVCGSFSIAALFPRFSKRLTGLSRRALARLSHHATPVLAAPVIVFGALVVFWVGGFPLPHIHDEFSYLLAADTFAHGRLANPVHPLWPSLETFHVNQQPAYVSMYLPGWGLVLAIGQVLVGHPWPAVWATALMMVLATHWAARGWLARPWALACALASAGLVAGGYWLTSYWGGSLAATGGALVVGSWPRILSGRRSGAFAFGVGAVILLYTRPWEGLPLVAAMGFGLLFRPEARCPAIWVPVMALAGLGGCWLGYYNWRTSGNPLEPAYAVNMKTYIHRRLLVFGSDREPPPAYRHEVMRRLYSDSFHLEPFSREALTQRVIPSFSFYGGHLLVFAVLALPWLFRDRRTRVLAWATASVWAAVLLTTWTRPHYLAPAMAGMMILSMQSLRLAGTIRWRGARVGRLTAYAALVGWLVMRGAIGVARLGEDASPRPWVAQRAAIVQGLEQAGGGHLILVRYGGEHNPDDEWVYNKADLGAGAAVIWSRAMDEPADGMLRRFYGDRTAWLLEFGSGGSPLMRKLGP